MDNDSYRRFLDGDDGAFDDIMSEHFRSLVFFIDRYVHDEHAAEDIAIDVMSDLIVHKHRYNFRVALKTYLFMIGRSRALDYLRHRRVIDISELSEETAVDDGSALEDVVIADERKRTVNRAIDGLPVEMRVVIHLIYFEDMSYEEAARVMKKNKKQVDNLLYRAKGALRLALGEDGEMVL